MKVRIIIVMGVVEGIDYYTMRFVDYIKKKGIDYYIVNVNDEESYRQEKLDEFAGKGNTVMFCFNNVGLLLETRAGNYWKTKGIPVFDYIVDHPRYFDDSMLDPPCDLYVFTLDEDHKEYIERFYPKVKWVWFSPNGGTEMTGSNKKWKDRSIDVIYMGDCKPYGSYPVIEELGDDQTEYYTTTANYMIREPMLTTERAIEMYLNERGQGDNEELLYKMTRLSSHPIESYVRRYFKLEGMKALDMAGVKVDIYGGGWENDNYKYSDNIVSYGRIKLDEMMDVIKDAKISLCFVPWYKRGCSEKNFDSMLNGALCVTDKSSYLFRNYRDGYNIVYFDLNKPEQMAMDVKWLLDNPEAAEKIAQRGYETAKKYDTWDVRFDGVLESMYSVVREGAHI